MVEGAPHTTKERSVDQLVCPRVPPAPVYKGARGEAGRPLWSAPGGVLLLLVGVGLPSFLLVLGGGKEGGEGERKGGGAPPLPSPIRTRGGGGARPALGGPSLSPLGPN